MDDFNKKPNIYPNLNETSSNEQQVRLNKINEIKDYFLAEIREKELIQKLSKYIASLDYFGKSRNVLSILSGSVSIESLAIVIGVTAGIIGASYSFTFWITSGFIKKFLKTIRNNKEKHNKIVMLAKSKLNSIENKISKALIDNEISHEGFETIINEEKNYRELKESIRMMNSHRNDVGKVDLIEESKKIGVNEVIKHNEIINNNLKYKYVEV